MSYLREYLGLFLFIYGLTFFFCNFGPNVTTFVIPSETFPTSIRATCHGISAASGKVGAVIGGAFMPWVIDQWGIDKVMFISSGISAIGLLWTFFLTEETMDNVLYGGALEQKKIKQQQQQQPSSLNGKDHRHSSHSSNENSTSSSNGIVTQSHNGLVMDNEQGGGYNRITGGIDPSIISIRGQDENYHKLLID